MQELPAVDELSVTLPAGAELQPVGTISSIIQQLGKRTNSHTVAASERLDTKLCSSECILVWLLSSVIVQSMKDTPPLNDDSIIFKSDRLAVGKVSLVSNTICSIPALLHQAYPFKVFEVFGPVSSPLYILRFNSNEEINSKGLTEGMTVYYAPTIKEYTEYVLPQQLKL